MEIQKLRALEILSSTGSYSETAERLFTTQSNISKQILSLEGELGVRLFDRSHRKAVITPAGELTLRRAKAILREYDGLLQDLNQGSQLRLACLPVMAHYGLTNLVSSFQARWPEIPLHLEELEGQDLPRLVEQGQAELAICRADRLSPKKFECLPLCRDHLAVIVPAGHPLAREQAISLTQLRGEPLLQIGESSTLYQMILDACAQAGFVPNIRYTSRRMENILAMVSDGSGISLMMERAAQYLPARGAAVVPLKEEIVSQLALVRLRDRSHSPNSEKFWEFARSWKQRQNREVK